MTDPTGAATARALFITGTVMAELKAKLDRWQSRLDERRAAAMAAFAIELQSLSPPGGVSRAEFAEVRADAVIDRWCQQRGAFIREILDMIDPDALVACQILGQAAELGQLFGLHLDNTLRELDCGLRKALNVGSA